MKIDLHSKNIILRDIESFSSDYIIVPRALMEALLETADPLKLRGVFDTWMAKTLPGPQALDVNSPGLHRQVKTVRKRHDITQAELAEEAGIEQPVVSWFERGDTTTVSTRKNEIVGALQRLIAKLPQGHPQP